MGRLLQNYKLNSKILVMNYRVLFSLLCLFSVSAYAQKKVVIYDLETRVPIRQVRVRVDKSRTYTTPYTGQLVLPEKFDTITVSHPKYLTHSMGFKEVGDSIGLIPRTRTLGKVEVVGEDLSKRLRENVEQWGVTDPKERQLLNPKTSVVDFDLVKIFDFKGRSRRRRTRKVKQALQKMDEKDPVKRAYEATVKDKGEKKEETTTK